MVTFVDHHYNRKFYNINNINSAIWSIKAVWNIELHMKKNKEKAMINAYASHQPGEPLKPFRYKPGPLNADEVEISIDYCGICHSDLSMIDNAWGMTTYPLVPGHEVIGKINNVGQDVTELSIGDTVGLGWHAGYCSTCASCLAGHHSG